ncbi:MAG: hypothetical protein K6V36_08305 [Anaerolineae bacterium]|nr:hypothetical protein [Anaerolineae bacterium]
MANKRVCRREFLVQASTLAAAGVLAACAPKAVPPSEPTQAPTGKTPVAEPTVAPATPAGTGGLVRFWAGWGGEGFLKVFETVKETEEWKEALGNNTFELKDATGDEPVLTAVAAGDPPDGAANIEYLDFMARGVLFPIDDLLAASTLIKKDDFVPGAWEIASHKGVTYGVPSMEGFLPFGANYNLRLVEEVGLDPNQLPETWDDWYAWHEKLTKKDDAGNVVRIGLNPYGAMGEGPWYAGGWMAPTSWGWKWFDDENKTFDLNNENMVDAFATFKRFVDLVGADNLAAVYSVEGHDDWGGAYNAEVEAIIIEGYWHPGETANSAPEVSKYNRATWLPVPEKRRGVKTQCVYTHMVIMFKDAKNPEVMYRLAEVLTLKPACDAFFKNLGWLPPIKTYYASVDPSVYPGLDFYLQSVDKVTEWHTPAKCEITRFVFNEYQTIKDKVNRNELTPAQAAEELQRRCEEEYKAAGFAS